MASPIIARADALMQRRRQNAGDAEDVPVLTDSIDDEDDIPVLVDAIPVTTETKAVAYGIWPEAEFPAEADPVVALADTPPAPAFDAALHDIIAHELARRVEQRLSAELPRLIEATVRDYLAEQEKIAKLQPRD